MTDIYVRTRPAYELNPNQRRALKLLAEHGEATVAGHATGLTDAGLVVHSETAYVLLRSGYVDRADDGIAINEDGLRKCGAVRESAAERRRRGAAEALEAQASGKWVPAPAGASAQADSDAAWARREFAEAHEELRGALDAVRWEREMLEIAERWDLPDDAERHRRAIEGAQARVEAARAEVDRLQRQRSEKTA